MTPDDPSWYSEKPKPKKQWAEAGHEHDRGCIWLWISGAFLLLGLSGMAGTSLRHSQDAKIKDLTDRLQRVEAVLKIVPVQVPKEVQP